MAKKSRKDLLKQDDVFITTADQVFSWLREYRTQVIAVAALVVAAVVGGLLAKWYIDERRVAGTEALSEAMELLDAAVEPDEVQTDAAASQDAPTFASEEEKLAALKERFESVVDAAGGGGAGLFARFYLADIASKLDDEAAAEKAFLELANELGPRDNLYFLALERAGYLQEQRGDLAAAAGTFARLASRKDAFYADRALFQQARLLADKGDTAGARALLEGFEKDFPESALLTEVKEKLEELGAEEGENLARAEERREPASEGDEAAQ